MQAARPYGDRSTPRDLQVVCGDQFHTATTQIHYTNHRRRWSTVLKFIGGTIERQRRFYITADDMDNQPGCRQNSSEKLLAIARLANSLSRHHQYWFSGIVRHQFLVLLQG